MAVAYSLAGPLKKTTRWLTMVERSIFHTLFPLWQKRPLYRSEAESKEPPIERSVEAATVLHRLVEEQGPWHAINNEMHMELLVLRQNCTRIADDLSKLNMYYGLALASAGQQDGGQHGGDGLDEATRVPEVQHIQLLISAIDDLCRHLERLGQALAYLRELPWARARHAHTWRGLEVEKSADGVPFTTRIMLPEPSRMYYNVVDRLKAMSSEGDKMMETWNGIRAADSRLAACLKEEGRLHMSRLNYCISEYAVVETRDWRPEGEEADASAQASRLVDLL
ncbi:hypothetical protein KVR01_011186 [Diaporthe batatas]|uniref:uncharacterized protein n=1 Tax=Diaporthe batatas TaxID=748121 RepID=UPI001D039D2A|nr:uncharacterized protein KVR01_011186 [Diaporthe batatas]KAG8158743.1 hypothetical protein KVR01_011186 [Diaporthe batatas]